MGGQVGLFTSLLAHEFRMTEASISIGPQHFINRELSWVAFNRRVLAQAKNPSTPLLERLKFLCICASNLDEFYMIRVANLREIQLAERDFESIDGIGASTQLLRLYEATQSFMDDLYATLRTEVGVALAKEGIEFVRWQELTAQEKREMAELYHDEIFPVLTPLTVDPAHPFPYLANLSLNLVVSVRNPGPGGSSSFAIVEIPGIVDRLISLRSTTERARYIFVDDVIKANLGTIFPSLEVEGSWAFRVTRNADLALEDQEVENLMQDLERELRDRTHRSVSRLEFEASMPEAIRSWLIKENAMDPAAAFSVNGPINVRPLLNLYGLPDTHDLKYPPFNPRLSPRFDVDKSIFSVIREGDVLLHHPYESFVSTAEFISYASSDPKVLAIKLTLYRTSGQSVIVQSLIEAARNGKQVTAVVELKARFDEENNISWARELERAGAHVVYGMVGLKTHCKTALIVRREGRKLRRYVHLSTGNYNSSTARFYTDTALLTCDPRMGDDVNDLFNILTGYNVSTMNAIKRGEAQAPSFHKLSIAPFEMRQRFEALIDKEIRLSTPENPGHIRAKFNSLTDDRMILKLYEASRAGVKIELNVRGMCCLRPGIPGVSDNIRVVSIVDRFLEHARIFEFKHGGEYSVWFSSADWMARNLNRRVETLFPIENEALRHRVRHEILDILFKDNSSSWDLQSDGTWLENKPGDEYPIRAQDRFIEIARVGGIRQIAYDQAIRKPTAARKEAIGL